MSGRPSGRGSPGKKRTPGAAAQPKAKPTTNRQGRAAPSPEAIARAKAKLSPPPPPWAPLPLAELAIALGFLAILVAAVMANKSGIQAGFLLIALGTAEFSLREHRHGYRSHATVLAMIAGVFVGALCWRFAGLQRNPCIAIGGVVFLIVWGLLDRSYVPASKREPDGSQPKAKPDAVAGRPTARSKNDVFKHRPPGPKATGGKQPPKPG